MEQGFKQLRRCLPAKRTIGTVIAFFIPLIVGWYAGYDMLERGGTQALCLVYSFAIAVVTWTCPIWPKN